MVSFLNGAVVIAFEILSNRLLSPYLGSTILTWSNLIACVLLGLALGNFTSGYTIKKSVVVIDSFFLNIILLMAALSILVVGVTYKTYCKELWALPWGTWYKVFLLTFITTFPVSYLLGLFQPLLYQLSLKELGRAGETAAILSATNTIGSLLGALFLNFILLYILRLSIGETLTVFSGLLLTPVVLSYFLFRYTWKQKTALWAFTLLVFGIGIAFLARRIDDRAVKFVLHNPYHSLQVVESKNIRFLRIGDSGFNHTAVSTDNPLLPAVGGYTETIRLGWAFNRNIKSILILGLGGGIMPRDLARSKTKAEIDVVEIDKNMYKIATDYFGYVSSNHIHENVIDARSFIISTAKKYDLVFHDLCGDGAALPEHLFTLEYFRQIKDRLSPRGVFFLNFFAQVPTDSEANSQILGRAIYSTLKNAFPDYSIFPVVADKLHRDEAVIPLWARTNIVFVAAPTRPNLVGLADFLNNNDYGFPIEFDVSKFYRTLVNFKYDQNLVQTDDRNLIAFYQYFARNR